MRVNYWNTIATLFITNASQGIDEAFALCMLKSSIARLMSISTTKNFSCC